MTNKKHGYDWEAMGLDPDEDRIIYAFEWGETPQGGYWWSDNEDTPEGKAEFARMKQLYAEDMAAMESLDWFRLTRPLWPNDEKDGPVRTVTRKEIVPGVYGHIWVDEVDGDIVKIGMRNNALKKLDAVGLSSGELSELIETLTQIRDAL